MLKIVLKNGVILFLELISIDFSLIIPLIINKNRGYND